VTLRTGEPSSYQFSPRDVFASLEQAHAWAECAFVSQGAEYLVENEHGNVTYRLKDRH